MNSEELELSLKAEFESYLNELFAGMRENAADLQKNFEAEFEKHRSQLDEATRLFAGRFENAPKLEPAFANAVTEHLRLAKDSGAELAAMAFSEAEKLNTEALSSASYASIRDAINDISSKTSQSTILTALVEHAAMFAPRGVFFIVKNESFVAWKRFGQDQSNPADVASLKFEAGEGTVLARAVRGLKTADGGYSESGPDCVFIDPLELGRPDRMYAIPLVARGRGVAVMYVDYGIGGTYLSLEALETLVRVAGLTVELLAASQIVSIPAQTVAPTPVYEAAAEVVESESESPTPVTEHDQSASVEETSVHVDESENHPETDFFVSKTFNTSEIAEYEIETVSAGDQESADAEPIAEAAGESVVEFGYETAGTTGEADEVETVEVETFANDSSIQEDMSSSSYYEPEVVEIEEEQPAMASSDFAFSSNDSFDASAPYTESAGRAGSPEPEVVTNGFQVESPVTPVLEVGSSQPRFRFNERNMDLPIEVPDEERRLHNDARRFARLLVSEIKLYNEQKVSEGRETGDLYDRLREAIDRSREMYEKRVQPTVASKFDYFHYELVNNLAEGQEQKLGHSYVATPV